MTDPALLAKNPGEHTEQDVAPVPAAKKPWLHCRQAVEATDEV